MNCLEESVRVPILRPCRYPPLIALLLLIVGVLTTACGVDLQNPPRLATATAQALATPSPPSAALLLPAPTTNPPDAVDSAFAEDPTKATVVAASSEGDGLTIWVNETSAEHKRVLDEIAAEFANRMGVNVAVQLVSPGLLPDLVSTGVLSGTLPDLVLYPNEFTAGWVADGILDPTAADEVIERLGRDTFDPSALDLVEVDNVSAAIPSDGFHQLLLYRADWFEDLGLAAPDNYAAMATAAERIYNPEAIISGLVIPTESNLVTTHQAFEQIALANGCRLIDEAGEVVILEPACGTAIEHYFSTINQFSPSGVQTDTSAVIAFLTGRTGMIITSPAILPLLAGFDESRVPSCAECDTVEDGVNYLARHTGIVTKIRGPNGTPTAFGNVRNLGITTTADREQAQAFAEFWFAEGYERWLAVNSERKVPMRQGVPSEPTRFIDTWAAIPLDGSGFSLQDVFGNEVVDSLRDGIASAPRWGIREGYGSLMTQLYTDFTISIVLQEMLSGYFDTQTTLQEAYRRTVAFIPNYAFPDRLAEEEAQP